MFKLSQRLKYYTKLYFLPEVVVVSVDVVLGSVVVVVSVVEVVGIVVVVVAGYRIKINLTTNITCRIMLL